MTLSTAYLSIGSNVGDADINCLRALSVLCKEANGVSFCGCSGLYLTSPQDYSDQPWFVNMAAKIRTDLDPFGLLCCLKRIEAEFGRIFSDQRFGPRIIDLDIVLYDDVVLKTQDLCIPHERMHLRRFVLEPLCAIDPYLVHPVSGKSVSELLSELDKKDQKTVLLSDGKITIEDMIL